MQYRWVFCTSLSSLLRITRWWLDMADGILCWWFQMWGRGSELCEQLHAQPESQRWWIGFFLSLSSWGEGKNETCVTKDWYIRISLFPFMSMQHHFPSIMVPMIGLSLYHMIRVLPSKRRRWALLTRLPTLIYPNMFMLEEEQICGLLIPLDAQAFQGSVITIYLQLLSA